MTQLITARSAATSETAARQGPEGLRFCGNYKSSQDYANELYNSGSANLFSISDCVLPDSFSKPVLITGAGFR